MSEFVNTYMHYEGMPLLGGNLLEFLELDPVPSINSNLNPAVSDCGLQNHGLLSGESIEIDQDLKVLEGLLDFHGDNVAGQSNTTFDFKPYSPSNGSDSGLSSPGSAWDDRLSPSPDILSLDQTIEPSSTPNNGGSSEHVHLFENTLPELTGIDMANAFGSTTDFNYRPSHDTEMRAIPKSEVSEVRNATAVPETEALLEELGISIDPSSESVEPTQLSSDVNQYEFGFMAQPAPTFNKIQLIHVPSRSTSVDELIKVNYIGNKPQVTERCSSNVVDCVSESSKPKSGRKRKITSAEERKERKREQNKTAATRYRERKRNEMLKRDEQLTALKTKNTSLKDEKNRIHREIDYLRELLVEVYKLKGVI